MIIENCDCEVNCGKGLPTIPFDKSLAVLKAEIALEWDFNRNNHLTPELVSLGSKYEAKWKHWSEKFHEWHYWSQPINKRTMRNQGCTECNGHRFGTDGFIKRAKLVHGERFDYSKTEYKTSYQKVVIICKEHGEFEQFPQAHWKGLVGCYSCNGQTPITTNEFIRRSKERFGSDRFNYSQVLLWSGGIHQKVILICIKHAESFELDAWSHIRNGSVGCTKCNKNSKYTLERVLEYDKKLFNGKTFDYSRVDWTKNGLAIQEIGCSTKDHGFFEQSLFGHTSGREGCAKCSRNQTSKVEIQLRENLRKNLHFSLNKDYKDGYVIIDGRKVRVDIIGTYNSTPITIEYDGEFFHRNRVTNDKAKAKLLLANNFLVINIREKGLPSLRIKQDNYLSLTHDYVHQKYNLEKICEHITCWLASKTNTTNILLLDLNKEKND